jgi:Yersinia/Haemophilus virulence surface antigen
VNAIQTILKKKLTYHMDVNEVSEDLSLGHGFYHHTDAAVQLRELKRATLLVYRVLGYHTSQETRALKAQVLNANEAQTKQLFKMHLDHGVTMYNNQKVFLQETLARRGGKLVHAYNQGDDGRLGQMDTTGDGWCLGMSVQWLRFKLTGGDFWAFHGTDEGAAAFRFVMAAQGVRSEGLGGSDMSDRAASVLKNHGLSKHSTDTVVGPAATPEKMAELICNSPHPFCRIGQLYVGGGGHAMAAYKDNGVTFLDPNAGEFHFKNPDGFKVWLPLFTRYMGYHFSKHYREAFQKSAQSSVVASRNIQRDIQRHIIAPAITARRAAMGLDDE